MCYLSFYHMITRLAHDPHNMRNQLVVNEPSTFGSAHTYQFRFGWERDVRDSWNQGCWEV